MWSENSSQWTILEPLCYSSFVFATLVHGVIGYKFCWLLPEDQNQGIPAGHESAETPIGNESCNNKSFKWAHGKTLDFLSMDRLWVRLKKFMHGMFVLTINTIETPCPGMNIVFNRMDSLHLTIWWNHIDLHFDIKDYYNVICIMFMYRLFSFNKIKYFLTQF